MHISLRNAVILTLLVSQSPLAAAAAVTIDDVRREVRRQQTTHQFVLLELAHGETVSGSIGKISRRTFEVVDQQGRILREVSYGEIYSFRDPLTGQVIAVVKNTWVDRHPRRFVALLGVLTGAVLIICVVSHIPST